MKDFVFLAAVLVAASYGSPSDSIVAPDGVFTGGGDSWAVSENYSVQFSVGQTFVGDAQSEIAEADAGFWHALWVAESPAGWVDPGWNWISLPTHPQFPAPSVVFETDPRNRLYAWDWLEKTFAFYPDCFSTLENTNGYLVLEQTGQTPRYSGFLNRTPIDDDTAPEYRSTTVYIPLQGMIMLGYPHPWPVDISDVKVRYGSVVRTAQEDKDAAANAWANWNWVYWDSATDTARLCSLDGGDDTMLRPWYHYRVTFNVPATRLDPNGPFLIIPEPEFEFGG